MANGAVVPLPSSRKRKAPDRWDPTSADSVITTHDVSSSDPDNVTAAKKRLKLASDNALFNAEPTLRMAADVCLIDTARINPRSKLEVWNYAYLTNKYLDGKPKKIKSTEKWRKKQGEFCGAVRRVNRPLFTELNNGKKTTNKLFSVVGHVPDQAISGEHGMQADPHQGGMYQVPGWLPMSVQANGLVANLAKQTGATVKEIWVDGAKPDCLIKPNQY